jgi:hypothetical protein
MGALCPGQEFRRLDDHEGCGGRLDFYLNALMAYQLDACTSVEPTTPIAPEDGIRRVA